MKTSDFRYHLPTELIAQTPIEKRDDARLLVCDRAQGTLAHKHFTDLPAYLQQGDCLVLNRTRVIPARLLGAKKDSGGAMEFLLLKRLGEKRYEVLVKPGRRAKIGTEFVFADCLRAKIIDCNEQSGSRIVEFDYEGIWEEVLDRVGIMPLPPYITEQLTQKERYQTVYSKECGSAAAPTAGLHFTNDLLQTLREKGVIIVEILLHVGLGTFRPVQVENVESHVMHSEYYEVSEQSAAQINLARQNGGKIFCVGTTSVRTLETISDEDGIVHAQSGQTNIFITPPYRFGAVDGLITNFHLPESTLLMLVSAFMGKEQALYAYETAVQERYRFFSFGDAMLII